MCYNQSNAIVRLVNGVTEIIKLVQQSENENELNRRRERGSSSPLKLITSLTKSECATIKLFLILDMHTELMDSFSFQNKHTL